jgi:hypothetical protein
MFDIIAFEASDTRNLTGTVSMEIQTIGVPRTHTAIVGELVTAGD